MNVILWVRVLVVGGLKTLTCIKQSKLDFFIVNGFNPVISKPVEYHRMLEPWSSVVILARMIDVSQSKPRVCTVSGLKKPKHISGKCDHLGEGNPQCCYWRP